MTSKKSYAKSPLLAVFRTQLYSQRMLLILFGVVLALVPMTVGFILLNPSNITYLYDYDGIDYYIAAQHQHMTICGLIPLLCFALALAVGEFGYLNQRRKLDFYHAIPVRRSDMFLGRALLASVSLVLGVLLVVLGQILIVNVQFVTISVGGGRQSRSMLRSGRTACSWCFRCLRRISSRYSSSSQQKVCGRRRSPSCCFRRRIRSRR